MTELQEFTSEKQRALWIIEHCDYFTTIRYRDRKYLREEHKSFIEARRHARKLVAEDKNNRVMIYAVAGGQSTWIENVMEK